MMCPRMTKARPVTNQLLAMMDEGVLDARMLAERCMDYMSEAEVRDMAENEGFIGEEADE